MQPFPTGYLSKYHCPDNKLHIAVYYIIKLACLKKSRKAWFYFTKLSVQEESWNPFLLHKLMLACSRAFHWVGGIPCGLWSLWSMALRWLASSTSLLLPTPLLPKSACRAGSAPVSPLQGRHSRQRGRPRFMGQCRWAWRFQASQLRSRAARSAQLCAHAAHSGCFFSTPSSPWRPRSHVSAPVNPTGSGRLPAAPACT